MERLRKAEHRLRQLRAAGINRPKLSVMRLRSIYMALLQPVWTYGVHLSPFSNEVETLAAKFIDAVTQWFYPKLQKHSRQRMRRLIGIEDADILRRIQMRKMVGSMAEARDVALGGENVGEAAYAMHDLQTASKLVERDGGQDPPEEEQLRRWETIE